MGKVVWGGAFPLCAGRITRRAVAVKPGERVLSHANPTPAMPTDQSSPRITHLSWGRIETEAPHGSFKDAKCYPGGARAWDWNETGTSHSPGIQPADVEELLEHGAEVVVLSKGINERLQVKPETLDMLEEQGVDTDVLQTERAVDRYNALQEEGTPVGGLFHSTC